MRRPLAPKMSDRTPPTRSPGSVDDPVDPAARPRPPGDDLPARARDPAQLAEVLRRNHARAAETELTYAGQPYAVGDIGLAALDLFDMLSVQQQRLGSGIGDGVENRLPIDAGSFHRRSRHAVFAEPGRKIGQTARKGAGLLRDAFRIRAGAGDAHGRGDLHLVNIQPGGAGMDDIELILLYHVTISCWGSCVEADRPADQQTHSPRRRALRCILLFVLGRVRKQGGARSRRPGDSLTTGSQCPHKKNVLLSASARQHASSRRIRKANVNRREKENGRRKKDGGGCLELT